MANHSRARRTACGMIGLAMLPLLFAFFYSSVAFVLMFFPANGSWRQQAEPAVQAYVIDNGVHTDLVFPKESEFVNWADYFPLAHFPALEKLPPYVALGWGDREFYVNAPRWRDLTLKRALDALAGGNESLLHVTYLYEEWFPEASYSIALSERQYRQLIAHVLETLKTENDKPVFEQGLSYFGNDGFYQARGSYSWLQTCNTWVGEGLQKGGIKVSAWTPFAMNVVWHLPAANLGSAGSN